MTLGSSELPCWFSGSGSAGLSGRLQKTKKQTSEKELCKGLVLHLALIGTKFQTQTSNKLLMQFFLYVEKKQSSCFKVQVIRLVLCQM